jgi:ABC-type lipoprotein release transport system permease subunit
VLLATGLARRSNLTLGDMFTFATRGNSFTGTVVGTYRDLGDGQSAYVRLEQIRQLDPAAPAGSFSIRLQPDQDPAVSLAVVRQRLAGRGQAIKATHGTDEIRTAQQVLTAIGAMIATLALGQLASSWLIGTRENRRELSVLQALGFTARQLLTKGAVSGTAIAAFGVIVAVPTASLAFWTIAAHAIKRAALDDETFDTLVSPVNIPLAIASLLARALLGAVVTRLVTRSLSTQDLAAY